MEIIIGLGLLFVGIPWLASHKPNLIDAAIVFFIVLFLIAGCTAGSQATCLSENAADVAASQTQKGNKT